MGPTGITGRVGAEVSVNAGIGLEGDLEMYVAAEQQTQREFFQELRDDPEHALRSAQSLIWVQETSGGYHASTARSIAAALEDLGLCLIVQDGKVSNLAPVPGADPDYPDVFTLPEGSF